ncbi:flavin monoamine oxidase family protein [Pontibacter sp. E15-1]|uniref:flavin monoamine oxidase family protein n=1 Tax=Pontibacter sp. E15-1 TaxID=2919918 RepID=UPI001F4F27F8|nr:flavin monoamine oxidase family protein [Pontibacter sp. E15-1]MCJ8166798.1 flavin monoamine oxidase family protein [Pontibacter sp. E15-1]
MTGISRRDFISKASVLAGSSYPAMIALGLLKAAPAAAFNLEGKGNGKHVIILGAGLAGMTAAYELKKLGYKYTILEARDRAGGRVWTVRNNTTETELDGKPQRAKFDDGQYFNAGAARIPHHHGLSLHYCRELGVQLETYNNINESGFVYNDGTGPLANKRIRIREIHNDMRGYTSELLAKAIDQDALDRPMTVDDKEILIEYLRAEGELDPDKLYKGTPRRGYISPPGAGDTPGKLANPYELSEIIKSGLIGHSFYNIGDYIYEQQMTMMQPVGGMDMIAKALEKHVGKDIQYKAEVREIRKTTDGTRVVYADSHGKMKELEGDYCICTIPLPVLSGITSDFSSPVLRAIDSVTYYEAGKIGLQFKRRFWEEDDHVFGGISRTNMDIHQIFYPSNGFLSKKGTLVGYYNFGDKAIKVGNLTLADREKLALEQGNRIHPQYKQEFESSFSLAWHKIRYSQGAFATYSSDQRQRFYPALLQPDGPVYFAGEHTTYLTAWMAGAFESARRSVSDLHERVMRSQQVQAELKG